MLKARGRLDESERLLKHTLERAAALGISEVVQIRLLNSLLGTLRQKANNLDPSQRQAVIDECLSSARQMLERGARMGAEGDWFVFAARQSLADLAPADAEMLGQFPF